VTDPVTATRTS